MPLIKPLSGFGKAWLGILTVRNVSSLGSKLKKLPMLVITALLSMAVRHAGRLWHAAPVLLGYITCEDDQKWMEVAS